MLQVDLRQVDCPPGAGARQDYLKEGPEILKRAAKWSPELRAALDVWGDVSFDYESTDVPDVIEMPTPVM